MIEELFEETSLIGDPNDIDDLIEGQALEGQEGDENDDDDDENTENAEPALPTEATGTPVEPKKKRVLRPQPKLNAERLMGPRGILVLEDTFKDFKFYGKGHERVDLNRVMKRLEHWAHRLFPKFQFQDCLEKIENLGHKKAVSNNVKKYRMGMLNANDVITPDTIEEEKEENTEEPVDRFDELLNEQIQKFTNYSDPPQTQPPQYSSTDPVMLTEEQRMRMEFNRKVAEARKLARLKAQNSQQIGNNDPSLNPASENNEEIPSTQNLSNTDSQFEVLNQLTPVSEKVAGSPEGESSIVNRKNSGKNDNISENEKNLETNPKKSSESNDMNVDLSTPATEKVADSPEGESSIVNKENDCKSDNISENVTNPKKSSESGLNDMDVSN